MLESRPCSPGRPTSCRILSADAKPDGCSKTESILVTQGETAAARLADVRALGVRISIDVLEVDCPFVLVLGAESLHAGQDQAGRAGGYKHSPRPGFGSGCGRGENDGAVGWP